MRNKAYYGLKTVKKLIGDGNCIINVGARTTALRDFGWRKEDIKKAMLRLQPNHFYKSDEKYDDPSVYVDYYKAYGLMGENVYIHFRVEDGDVVICSFKEI